MLPLLSGRSGGKNHKLSFTLHRVWSECFAFPNTIPVLKVAANNLSRDAGFGVQNYGWSRLQSERGKAKVYLYSFNRKVPEFVGTNKFGAFHTGEVMYAYDNLKFLNRPLEKVDFELATLMSSYWVNFEEPVILMGKACMPGLRSTRKKEK